MPEGTKFEQLAGMLEKFRDKWPDLDSGVDNIDAIIEDPEDVNAETLEGASEELNSLKEELEEVTKSIEEIEKFIDKNFPTK